MRFAAAALTMMENINMMLDWNEYRQQLAAGVKEISQLSSDTVRGYVELSSAGQKKDLLGAKMRELIALAVAVTARCDGCIAVHSEAAIRHGARRRHCRERGRGARLLDARNGCGQGISARGEHEPAPCNVQLHFRIRRTPPSLCQGIAGKMAQRLHRGNVRL
jgi:AhpD family alkylhydroperoxidase